MSFFNEKWQNSSIATKVAMWSVLLTSILFLVCGFTIQSWINTLNSLAQNMGSTEDFSGINGYFIMYLLLFLIEALLAFGLFKVVGIARFLVILQGLGSVLGVILSLSAVQYLMEYARETAVSTVGENLVSAAEASHAAATGILAGIMPTLIKMIPPDVFAKMGVYLFIFLGPIYLPVLSMLILFFCGKDFKKIKKQTAKN